MASSTSPANSVAALDPTTMTWQRWRVVLLLMAICFLGHFNRISMVAAGDLRIMKEYDVSPTRMGLVYSAFLFTYTLVMIPGGWLVDRRGPRFCLQMVCFGSAVCAALTGCVALVGPGPAIGALVVVRSLMGVLNAPLHPGAAKAVSLEIPVALRSTANGLVTGAALLGVASTQVLFGQLIDWFDWPAAFVLAALLTAAVGWLWSRYALQPSTGIGKVAQDDSAARSRLAMHEELISSAATRDFLHRNKNLLLLTLSYAAVGYFQYLFFYWMHHYFEKILDLGEQESRFYSAIPPLAMALGMPLGGWLSDRLQASFGRRARAGLVASAMTTSAGLLLLGIGATEPFWIVTWLSLALGVLGAAEGPFWVTAIEAGRHHGGLSAGIVNTGGNAGGALAPVVTPWISNTLDFGWQAGIAVGSLVCLLGALSWKWIDVGWPSNGEQTDR